jgi:hypothetical protein
MEASPLDFRLILTAFKHIAPLIGLPVLTPHLHRAYCISRFPAQFLYRF